MEPHIIGGRRERPEPRTDAPAPRARPLDAMSAAQVVALLNLRQAVRSGRIGDDDREASE